MVLTIRFGLVTDAIVRSLFPAAVADRLYEDARRKEAEKRNAKNNPNHWVNEGQARGLIETPKLRVKRFMRSDNIEEMGIGIGSGENSKPIADLFPHTTILFADLAGFTAWSSEREPCQVFTLLETIYGAMGEWQSLASTNGFVSVPLHTLRDFSFFCCRQDYQSFWCFQS
jgi:Adenylate and Guanylate cyclase catalytic domain